MPEYRQDPLTGSWVLLAPGRHARPFDQRHKGPPDHDSAVCPFCPGNERLLGRIVRQWPSSAAPGWTQRAVLNLYPALEADPAPPRADGALPGRGRHWVLIDTPRHDAELQAMTPTEAETLMRAYRDSFRELAQTPGTRFVSLFRNRGGGAGASLRHPHSQLVAADRLPAPVARSREWLRGRAAQSGTCPLCDHVAATVAQGDRLVEATADFTTIVPFAPVQPLEQLIVPRRHAPCFGDTGDEALAGLARAVQAALRRLDALLGQTPCNLSVESALPDEPDARALHWHVRLVPRLTLGGGFEQSAGMAIVPAMPGDDAARLRDALPCGPPPGDPPPCDPTPCDPPPGAEPAREGADRR